MTDSGGARKIYDTEVDDFCVKLERWAETLEPTDQAMARLMLARARRSREVDVEGVTYEGNEPWADLIASVFRSSGKRMPEYEFESELGAYFAKESGPSWVKGTWIDSDDVAVAEPLPRPPAAASGPSRDPSAEVDDAASALLRFAEHLEAYAGTLSPRDRAVLQLLLLRAMDPVERVRWTSPPDLLDDGQEALLQDLADRYRDI
jgi:hypothetical protein